MRAMFYAPIADPDATAASGVQRMGTLLQRALRAADIEVTVPTLPRTFDGRGDGQRQRALQAECARAADDLLEAIERGALPRPDLWFSYHVYYKSPDWIGPRVANALGIPYLIAEGSHAPKRAGGPWALGHEGTTRALESADRLFALTAFDRVCLEWIAKYRVRDLKPFIDVSPFGAIAAKHENAPHLIAVGMMRNERKRASFALLAQALQLLADTPLTLTIVGDGAFRPEIVAMFAPGSPQHAVRFTGAVPAERIPALLAEADVFAWPGLGEAYGLVFLEAQAAGLPVVACHDRGVPDAVREHETALLSPAGDVRAYAANLRALLHDGKLRQRMAATGRSFVANERSVEAAAETLRHVIAEVCST